VARHQVAIITKGRGARGPRSTVLLGGSGPAMGRRRPI